MALSLDPGKDTKDKKFGLFPYVLIIIHIPLLIRNKETIHHLITELIRDENLGKNKNGV
jgi:hypothetical protein